ncbi:DNA modification system-associated small protein [Bacillus sp. AL-1R]
MTEIKKQSDLLLESLCKENDIPKKLILELFKSAKNHSYENLTQGARKKNYTDLIEFYIKKD